MPPFSKWPPDVIYTFFTVMCLGKKTLFCRKKVFSVVSMSTKKVFCVCEVFQLMFLYIKAVGFWYAVNVIPNKKCLQEEKPWSQELAKISIPLSNIY